MQATSAVSFSRPGRSTEPLPVQSEQIRPLLELALAQTGAQGAYLYRFAGGENSLWLTAWAGLAPRPASATHTDIPYPAVWEPEQCTPVVLHENAWTDWRFRSLVEFERHRFEGVVSVPLPDGEQLVGVVNFCRSRRLALLPRDLLLLLNLGAPLSSLLTGAAARTRLESELKLTKQLLEDRKLLDRAKGLLQARYRWTEEKAYIHIRRLSRQQRVPKRNIAAEIIEAAGIHAVRPAERLDSDAKIPSGVPEPLSSDSRADAQKP